MRDNIIYFVLGLFTPGAGYMRVCTSMYAQFDFWSYLRSLRERKKIVGTCFVYGPIFRHFEFYDNLINWAKLRYYTLETYMSASFKDWKIWFFVYFQYKVSRNTTILFWKTEWGHAATFSSFIFVFLKISYVQWTMIKVA